MTDELRSSVEKSMALQFESSFQPGPYFLNNSEWNLIELIYGGLWG
jgi:hypothetical protein